MKIKVVFDNSQFITINKPSTITKYYEKATSLYYPERRIYVIDYKDDDGYDVQEIINSDKLLYMEIYNDLAKTEFDHIFEKLAKNDNL